MTTKTKAPKYKKPVRRRYVAKKVIAKPVAALTAPERKGAVGVLTKMYEIFDNRKAWIKGDFANITRDSAASFPAPTATQFCLVGAARFVDTAHEANALRALATAITADLYGESPDDADRDLDVDIDSSWKGPHPAPEVITDFNDRDSTTYGDMRRVLRKAIDLVKTARASA